MIAWLLISALPQFLDDQRNTRHELQPILDSKAAVVLLVGNERKSADGIREWLRVFAVPRTFKVYGLADLRRVPFFVPKSMIRNGMAEMLPTTPVLLDLDGDASDALALPKGLANVVVYRQGKRLGVVMGPASEDKVPQVMRLLEP